MLNKRITVSSLLAIALAFSGCGGGGNTTSKVGEKGDAATDNVAPVFAENSVFTKSIDEGRGVDVATYFVSDDNPVTFTLGGEDAKHFILNSIIDGSDYQVALKFKTVPDYENKTSYNVTLTATDEYNNSTSKDITVNVIDQPFAFDIAGNMGTVIGGSTKTLSLVTKEAKSNVTYQLIGDPNFRIDGDQLVFTAPAYKEVGNNIYIGIVKASDGISDDIELTVKATVVKDANTKPEPKNFLLKSRRDIDTSLDFQPYTDHTYTYDSNGYLIEIVKSGTNIVSEKTTFEYSDDHRIMRGYQEPGHVLKSIRVFADKKTENTKVIADIDMRLSEDQYVNYMAYIQDTAALKNNRHLVKHIHGLEFFQRKVELYVYNNNDQLSRVLTGSYKKVSYESLIAMTDAQLKSPNIPSGGFPSGDVKLSTAQLNSLNSGTLPVHISHETTYVYDNNTLSGRRFFGYAGQKEFSDNVNVTYFANGVIKSIESNGVVIEYDTDSLLDKVTGYDYSYTINNNKATVTVTHNGKTVTTYIFEEE